MNEISLKIILSKLNIGGLRYFDSIGSTNDEALAWAAGDARDMSIVVADEQTQGRGRLQRKWFTPKGSALAFSIILRPSADGALRSHLSRTVGLAALSVADSCLKHGLATRIKWPNDILLNGKKAAGILIETVWSGADVDSLVLGMGVNILAESVLPDDELRFPATSLEDELGNDPPAREDFLFDILSAFISRRKSIATHEFLKDWNDLLAFRGEQVEVTYDLGADGKVSGSPVTGVLIGLEADGSLRLDNSKDEPVIVQFGDVSLRRAP
jgi:BirA family transcriptional regulator, biotin operon repressor / biotin---[acetyl-CoA-carboxylase] ligase